MSEEEQEVNQEEEEEEENDDEEEEDGDEDEEEEGDEDEEEEEGDQDQEEQGDEDQEEGEQAEEEKEPSKEGEYKLPDFPRRSVVPENPFDNILYELGSLQNSVDSLINTFPSKKGFRGSDYLPVRSSIRPPLPPPSQPDNRTRLEQLTNQLSKMDLKPSVVHVKDEDTQVDMHPMIVIQTTTPTHSNQPQDNRPFEASKTYQINSESEKFLKTFDEESKKYRRWDRTEPEFKNRQRFERKDYQKGVFDLQARNKEIDQAMRQLRQ